MPFCDDGDHIRDEVDEMEYRHRRFETGVDPIYDLDVSNTDDEEDLIPIE